MKTFIFLCITCLLFSGCTAIGYLLGSTINQNEEIEVIQPGTDIYITLVNGNKTEGQFSGVKDSSLYLVIENREWAIPMTDIDQTQVPDIKWRFIGAAVGLGVDMVFVVLVMTDGPMLGENFRMGF